MTTPSSADNSSPTGGQGQTQAGTSPLGQIFNSGLIGSTAREINNNLGSGITSVNQPQSLRTFVYAPEVKVIIAHGAFQYDVSADIVRCQLVRPENSAATFIVTLHNKDLRYTPLDKPRFYRMDRITVYMKKTSWTQVFSGYLDTVPYQQLYPGTVQIKATCTIKRLMHTWVNPDLDATNRLLQQLSIPGFDKMTDSGLGRLLQRVLVQIGGWSLENIHIQNFPVSFFNFIQSAVSTNQSQSNYSTDTFYQMLLGSNTTPGPGADVGSNPNAGVPGPGTPGVGGVPGASAGVADTLTMFYISQIVAACDDRGMGPLVSDNNLSAGLAQAGEVGAASGGPYQNPGQQKAWQMVQQTNLDAQQANRNSDAAILCTAAAMAETGFGTGIRNVCNPSVPNSDQYANDGPGLLGTTGVGILALPTANEWGNLAQRMNPKQAAGMFMYALGQHSGWRNMNPGEACSQTLRNNASAKYEAAVAVATEAVKAYRLAMTGPQSTVANAAASTGGVTASTGFSATGLANGSPGVNSNLVTGAASATPAPVISAGTTNPTRTNKPQPDSEGAINWAMTQMGKPYVWGGKGPLSYDCSGLVSAAFKSIGIDVPSQTDAIRGAVPKVPNNAVQRGDLVEPSEGHVVIWCGDGTIIEAPQSGDVVHRVPSWIGPPSSWAWVGRACLNGGVDPTAPFNPPETMGPGTTPGALDQQAGATGVGSAGAADGVARNLFSYIFNNQFTGDTAAMFTGKQAFINGQPLLQLVQAIASAGLRNWSSAPNGDLMFWYPDYWGLDGKPAVLRLEDIELQDVHIDFSDDPLTTHVYVAGDHSMMNEFDPITNWLGTSGVVTVENEQQWLFQRLIQIAPMDDETLSGDQLMKRYGIRPMKQVFAMAGTSELEFLLATKVFMEKWAQQYQTTISMTFMPELFPGMRVQLTGNKNLQVYVSAVTHVCDYEQGFHTEATIMAPSTPMAKKLMATVKTAQGVDSTIAMAFANGALPTDTIS